MPRYSSVYFKLDGVMGVGNLIDERFLGFIIILFYPGGGVVACSLRHGFILSKQCLSVKKTHVTLSQITPDYGVTDYLSV